MPVQILLEDQPDAVISVGKTHLHFYNFNNTGKVPERKKVLWKDCHDNNCNYNITLVHQREEGKPLFVCGTNSRNTRCCDVELSGKSRSCDSITDIRESVIKEGEQSALVENNDGPDLYLTFSGINEDVGIHKFGRKRVRPASHNEEQYYLGLVVNRKNPTLESKVYAFYKQKSKDIKLDSDMWIPYVSRVCMADAGGPKSNLQFSWTSLMNARLYCGHPTRKQHFSELVDVFTVHANKWEDTTIYALFRNEWGMSAVCIYRIRDIDKVFTNSPFVGSQADDSLDKDRKKCVSDSTKISTEILKRIEKVSEMKEWVLPVNNSGPLLFKHLNYTRIYVDASPTSQHTVMFLTLSNGATHKALHVENHSFIIAENRPFNYSAHISSIIFHPSSRKLYVNSDAELVQINMGNCEHYGNTCQECVLSNDPYCSWKNDQCTSRTSGTHQMVRENLTNICPDFQASKHPLSAKENKNTIIVQYQSSHILRCPISSQHAQYTWHGPEGSSSCTRNGDQCLLLIDSMTPKQDGEYKCESEEMGYRKVVAQYELRSRAVGFSPTVWVFALAVFKSVCT